MKLYIRPLIFILLCLVLIASACSSDKKEEEKKPLSSKEIAKTVGKDVVFLSNDFQSGSGILLADGYIVTNNHVIDGFDEMDITFENGDAKDSVPVYAVDAGNDLALLGPVKQRGSLDFGSTKNLDKGDEVYFVGYPEETDENPDTTITKGILSRVRTSADKKTSFLQTDAEIAGGQSGGAMVNTFGEIVGVSGLGDESFGFALASESVKKAINEMRSDPIAPYSPYPTTTDDKRAKSEFGIDFKTPYSSQYFVGYSDKKQTLTLTFPSNQIPALDVYDYFYEVYESNNESLDLQDKLYSALPDAEVEEFEEEGTAPIEDIPSLNQKSPGVYEIKLPKETFFTVALTPPSLSNPEFSTTLKSSIPLVVHKVRNGFSTMKVGQTKTGVIDSIETSKAYEIELKEGQTYTISARATVGDVSYFVLPADGNVDQAVYSEDAEENAGIFATDAIDEFTPKRTTKYVIIVATDGYSTDYKLNVKKGELDD